MSSVRNFPLKKKWNMKNKIILLALCFGACAFASGKEEKKSTWVVGTNAEFAPFCFQEEGKIVGFDIDIVQEVAKRLEKKMELKDMPFEALLPDLMLGKITCIAAGMSATKERAKKVSFTRPYLQEDPLVVIMKIQNKASFQELKGKTIVVNDGFTAAVFLSSQEGYKTLSLPTTADAFLALSANRASAFITAKSTVKNFFLSQDPSQFYVEDLPNTGENCALVVNKNNIELLEQIQKALDSMEADGTVQALKEKWGV